jgi:hypothetical protein
MKLTCGTGNHTEIIGSEYATCLICKSVRKLTWLKVGSKYYVT